MFFIYLSCINHGALALINTVSFLFPSTLMSYLLPSLSACPLNLFPFTFCSCWPSPVGPFAATEAEVQQERGCVSVGGGHLQVRHQTRRHRRAGENQTTSEKQQGDSGMCGGRNCCSSPALFFLVVLTFNIYFRKKSLSDIATVFAYIKFLVELTNII